MIKKYLANISDTQKQGDQGEESYYPVVANLMMEFANFTDKKETSVTILPKKTEVGNPDFRIWDGNNKIIGYIEAKIPETNLNKTEISEQLKRYRETFPNVILTNFYEFRLYRSGKLIEKAELLKTPDEDFLKLLQKFFDFSLPKIFTSEILAVELAKRTRFLRDKIISVELESKNKRNYIKEFYNAFKKYLISGLKKSEFADLYSQTITYGMFAAKTRTKPDEIFKRKNAIYYIPPAIVFLRDVFEFVSLGKLPPQMEIIIDDIAEVLQVADAGKLLNDYYKKGKGDDPIIHFYETFLNEYDPETREKRGVFYTPEPVVKYIVNSVNEILIRNFDKIGFADKSVKVLDPASGTLTFLAEAVKKSIKTFTEYYGEGGKKDFIKKHILKNFYGFELMMSPYAIAHLKMSYILKEEGYTLEEEDRFQLYLTNTLNAKIIDMPELPGLSSLAEEAVQANNIRKKIPILAIIGNPPYSIASYNKSKFETELMKLYKKDVKNEKNIQILSDDYIKFVRYCHWKIEESGTGITALITKNTYINIAAAKGMRKQLLLTFDEIYILNLHGKLYEKTPESKKDQNVFDIRVGTAIMFLVKNKARKKRSYAKLYYKDLYGIRDIKYNFLNNNNIFSTFTKKEQIKINKTHFFFEKKNFSNPKLYNKFWAIDEIFDVKSSGITTGRDHFVTDNNKNILRNRINLFINSKASSNEIKEIFNIENRIDFNIEKAKKSLTKIEENKIKSFLYKPFTNRFIYYEKYLLTRNRANFMKNFAHKNIGIVITRRQGSNYFRNVFVTDKMTNYSTLGVNNYIFPLWIYKQNADAFNGKRKNKVSNINPKFEELLQENYGEKNITEKIFYYVYAVLYSNTYRKSFPELLKIDYPKIPFTKNVKIFEKIAKLGKELAELHLLKSPKVNRPKIKFRGTGNGIIEKSKYDKTKKIVEINNTQYFENIIPELWDFKIGKNQILKQWFKQKEKIELENIIELGKITTAIYETFNIQNQTDKIYYEILKDLFEN